MPIFNSELDIISTAITGYTLRNHMIFKAQVLNKQGKHFWYVRVIYAKTSASVFHQFNHV